MGLLVLLLAQANPAEPNTITNGGFEAGTMTGWSVTGSLSAAVGGSPPGPSSLPLLSTGLGNASAMMSLPGPPNVTPLAGTFFGLLSTASPGEIGVLGATDISQMFTPMAGDILQFSFRFLTNEDELSPGIGANDFFTAYLVNAGGTTPIETFSVANLFAGPPTSRTLGLGGFIVGSADWTAVAFDLTSFAGTPVTLRFAVTDMFDTTLDSAVALDSVSISSPIPEPGTLILLGLGLAGLAGAAGLRRDSPIP